MGVGWRTPQQNSTRDRLQAAASPSMDTGVPNRLVLKC